jgi:hypothetical protein
MSHLPMMAIDRHRRQIEYEPQPDELITEQDFEKKRKWSTIVPYRAAGNVPARFPAR